MEIKAMVGDIARVSSDAVVVSVFAKTAYPGGATGIMDKALDGAISSLIEEGEIRGGSGEVTVIHTLGRIPPRRVVVVGLGKWEDFTEEIVRSSTAVVCRRLRHIGVRRAVMSFDHGRSNGVNLHETAEAISEGATLGLYRFNRHKRPDADAVELDELVIISTSEDDLALIEAGLRKGCILAEAANTARDMVNEPANLMTPTKIAEISRGIGENFDIDVEILGHDRMTQLGMGALLGVARGSHQEAKLIVMRYRGNPDDSDINFGLVGKGITFDSGGISLKAAGGMWEMKGDMSGAAAVIGAMQAIAQLRPRVNVIAVAPCTENMPGGAAQKPGDVVCAMNGKTIEVDNTDAEGRLALADAICYVRTMGVKRIIDVATLTGAISTSLGDLCMGGFTNNQDLYDRVAQSANLTGEKIWQLPMYSEYKEQNKSDVADIKNTGGRGAGSITAAHFLAEFVEDTPWVHLDIAGTFMAGKDKGYHVKGATGVPVRTLVTTVLNFAGV